MTQFRCDKYKTTVISLEYRHVTNSEAIVNQEASEFVLILAIRVPPVNQIWPRKKIVKKISILVPIDFLYKLNDIEIKCNSYPVSMPKIPLSKYKSGVNVKKSNFRGIKIKVIRYGLFFSLMGGPYTSRMIIQAEAGFLVVVFIQIF